MSALSSEKGRASLKQGVSDERQFRTLIEQSFWGMYLEQDGKLLYVSPRLAEMTGCAVREMPGRPLLDFIAAEDRAAYEENCKGRRDETGRSSCPLRLSKKDGRKETVEIREVAAEYKGRPAVMGLVVETASQGGSAAGLPSAHESLNHLLEYSPAVIYTLRLQGGEAIPEMVSENITALLGFSRDEALQPGWWYEHTHADDRERLMSEISLLQKQGHVSREYRIRHKDGRYLWVEDSQQLVCDEKGTPTEIVGIWADITERKQAEIALRESEARARAITDFSPVGIFMSSPGGEILYCNQALLEMLRTSLQQTLGSRWTVLVHPDDRSRMIENWQQFVSGRSHVYDLECRCLRSDGDVRTVHVRATPIRDGERILGYTGTAVDMTDRKRTEDALRESEAQFRASFEMASVGKAQINPVTGQILRVNAKLCEMVGYTKEELLAMTSFEITHPSDVKADQAALRRLRGGQDSEFHREKRYIRKDGTTVWVDVNVVIITDAMGRPARASAIIQDITERKRNELRVSAFSSLGKRLNAARSARQAAEIIVDVADQLIGWDACTLDLYLAEKDEIYHLLNRDIVDGKRVDCPPAYTDTAPSPRYRSVIENGAQLILKEDPQVLLPGTIPFGDRVRASASIILVPVRDSWKVIGVLAIHSYRTLAYTDYDLQTLQALADHCGGALNRIHAEESYARERVLLRTLIDNLPGYIFVKDTAGRYLLSNRAHTHLMGGASESDLVGKTVFDFVPPEIARVYDADDQRVMQNRQPVIEREEPYEAEGQQKWCSVTKVPFFDARGGVSGLIGIKYDITERKKTEVALRSVNERYSRQEQALTRLTHIYLLSRDLDELLKEVTAIAAKTLEVERASVWRYGKNEESIVCHALYERTADRYSAGVELKREQFPSYFNALRDSDVIVANDAHHDPRTAEFSDIYLQPLGINSMLDTPLHAQGALVGVLCCEHVGPQRNWTADEQTFAVAVANLVSLLLAQADRQKLEQELRQAQKMEAIGQLAGGVAHDFNNILGAIVGYTELAKLEAADNSAALECLGAIEQASRRATDLVHQILTFSWRRDQKREPVQLQHIVREAIRLLRATVPATIEISSRLPQTRAVLADASEVHQILMNLGTNAWHAMRDKTGVLTIELADFEVDQDFARSHPELRPGNYVRLSVNDTGCGMEQTTQERIFEPFFTTKAPGEGTGLGLSVVHGIMKNYEGTITLYSKPGEGSTFHLYFPAFDAAVTESEMEAGPEIIGNGEHILFVDDEASLASLGKTILERYGYVVTAKHGALEALSSFRKAPERFDLIITDFAMPVMNGLTFSHEVLKIRPDIPIILTTGYNRAITEEKTQEIGIRELLIKPNNARTLGEAVKRVIGADKLS